MSTYALLIRDDYNRVVFDSRSAQGGVYLGAVTLAVGASGSVTYSGVDVQWRSMRVQVLMPGAHDWSVDNDSLGAPRLTYSARASTPLDQQSILILWAS